MCLCLIQVKILIQVDLRLTRIETLAFTVSLDSWGAGLGTHRAVGQSGCRWGRRLACWPRRRGLAPSLSSKALDSAAHGDLASHRFPGSQVPSQRTFSVWRACPQRELGGYHIFIKAVPLGLGSEMRIDMENAE